MAKGAIDWICKKKYIEPGGRIQIQVNTVGRKGRILPKDTAKLDPLYSALFKMIGYTVYSIQEWNNQNKLDFTLMAHQS